MYLDEAIGNSSEKAKLDCKKVYSKFYRAKKNIIASKHLEGL